MNSILLENELFEIDINSPLFPEEFKKIKNGPKKIYALRKHLFTK